MADIFDDIFDDETPGAPEVRIEPKKVVDFQTRRRPGAGAPEGNTNAWKTGMYSQVFSAEEQADRAAFETSLCKDQGGDLPAGKMALIGVVGLQYMLIRRGDQAVRQGKYIPQEHLIALLNSFRLNLSALGLERRSTRGPTLAEYLERGGDEETEA